jgi:hypothetical protein
MSKDSNYDECNPACVACKIGFPDKQQPGCRGRALVMSHHPPYTQKTLCEFTEYAWDILSFKEFLSDYELGERDVEYTEILEEYIMAIPTDIPENHGLSSRSLIRFLERIEQFKLQVNSFMLLQDGATTAQFWRTPYHRDCPQLIFSLSKSFTSIAAGIAWDQGLLDLTDPVISFFPDKVPSHISPNLARMTVHHLLSMNAGHDGNKYGAVTKEQDWVKAFLAQEVEHQPGTHYRYSTPATYMISAIIERVTGRTMVDFLQPTLFVPLGIPKPSWETCPLGTTAGGMGLSLTTESVAKFGLMLLNKGKHEGRTIVSEKYVALATTEQSDNRAEAKPNRIDTAQGYGYQFHMGRQECYRGGGAFGQLCLVAPQQRIVIAATSAFPNGQLEQTLLDLIYEHILDPLAGQPLSPSVHTKELNRMLSQMTCAPPNFLPIPKDAPNLNDRCYDISENPHGLQKIRFRAKGEQLHFELIYGDERDTALPLDLTQPERSWGVFVKDLSWHRQEAITYAGWQNSSTLKLTVYYIETPYVVNYELTFEAEKVEVHFHSNVSLEVSEYKALGNLLGGKKTVI